MEDFILSFSLLFIVIVGISYIVKLLRQPIIIGYVLAGILFLYFDTGMPPENIIMLSELGITFMLFLMGLEFDLKSLRYLGKDLMITALMQTAIFMSVSFGVAFYFGYSVLESVYLSLLFVFSSTLLVAKWVEDKKEGSTLHGKIILSTLIIQDVLAIVALTVLQVVQHPDARTLVLAPLKGVMLIGLAFLLSRFVLNRMLRFSSRFPELLFVFSLGVCFLFVYIAPLLGYSTTIGAFIAGITLANTIYREDISSRLGPLIIFFNMLFFVGLGFQMDFGLSSRLYTMLAVFCLLAFLVKPAVIYLTLRLRKYDSRTSFLTGIYLSQMSEFGIIILASAAPGLMSQGTTSFAVISVIFTMVASSYFIKYDKALYQLFEKAYLKFFGSMPESKVAELAGQVRAAHIIFIGYHEIAQDMLSRLDVLGKKVLVIDNDPENIEQIRAQNLNFHFGSVFSPGFIEHLNLSKAELVISSDIDVKANSHLIVNLKKAAPKAVFIGTAKSFKDSLALYDNGADYVICPSYLNERQVSVLVEDYTIDINKLISKKIEDIERLRQMDSKRKKKDLFVPIESFLKNGKSRLSKLKNPLRKNS